MNEEEARRRLKAIEREIFWLYEIRDRYHGIKSSKKEKKTDLFHKILGYELMSFLFALLVYGVVFYLFPMGFPQMSRGSDIERIEVLLGSIVFFNLFFLFDSLYTKNRTPRHTKNDIETALERLKKEREEIYERFPDIQIKPEKRFRISGMMWIYFLTIIWLLPPSLSLSPLYSAISIWLYFIIAYFLTMIYYRYIDKKLDEICHSANDGGI
jgi:uncharacterized RDD family membrane protein YckC